MADTPLRVLILGATSGIAQATARLYAAEGASLLLVARNEERLAQIADDLKVRGAANVETAGLDLATADAGGMMPLLVGRLGGSVDHVHIAYGIMPELDAFTNLDTAAQIFAVNYSSTALWSLAAARVLETQGRGSLVVLGSAAGDRGRRKNFVYGSTKAGIATLVEGIAHRFADSGPRAVVIKPGPTATAMTAGRAGRMDSAEDVARVVRRAADSGGPAQYASLKWWVIMTIVRSIPWPIFRRTNF